jgi:cyclophilin family peptidyl-prolyl cis-trans isomerase
MAQMSPIGTVDLKGGLIAATIASETQRAVAITKLPMTRNKAVSHTDAGVLGMSGPSQFYITTRKNTGLDGKYTALGKIVAGAGLLPEIEKGDQIRSIRITRVGPAARDFKVDDETFKTLLTAGKK